MGFTVEARTAAALIAGLNLLSHSHLNLFTSAEFSGVTAD